MNQKFIAHFTNFFMRTKQQNFVWAGRNGLRGFSDLLEIFSYFINNEIINIQKSIFFPQLHYSWCWSLN